MTESIKIVKLNMRQGQKSIRGHISPFFYTRII